MVHCSWQILLKGHDSSALRHEGPWRLCRGSCHFLLKLFLSNCCMAIQVLYKGVGGSLQFTGWDRAARLKGTVHRLSDQICELLVRKREFLRHQWRNEKKSCKNGAQHIHLRSQAEISTHQVMFAQKFEVGFEACQPLCVGSATLLAVRQLPYHVHIAQEDRLHQRAFHQNKGRVFEYPSQRCTRGIALDALLDLHCHLQLFTFEKRCEQRFSRFPVQIHGAFGYASLPGDIVEGGLVVAPAQDQCRGGIQNALCSNLAPGYFRFVCARYLALLCQTSFSFVVRQMTI